MVGGGKAELKRANGTNYLSYNNSGYSASMYIDATFTVSGLDFTPHCVCWYCTSKNGRDTTGYAINSGSSITTRQKNYADVYAGKSATFTDGGFSIVINHGQVYDANNWPVYWWAIGM